MKVYAAKVTLAALLFVGLVVSCAAFAQTPPSLTQVPTFAYKATNAAGWTVYCHGDPNASTVTPGTHALRCFSIEDASAAPHAEPCILDTRNREVKVTCDTQ